MPGESSPRLDAERRPFAQEIPLVDLGELVLKSDVALVREMEPVDILGKLYRDPRRLDAVPKLLVFCPPAREPLIEGQVVLAD